MKEEGERKGWRNRKKRYMTRGSKKKRVEMEKTMRRGNGGWKTNAGGKEPINYTRRRKGNNVRKDETDINGRKHAFL